MFISFFNTFLAIGDNGLEQKDFCDLYGPVRQKTVQIATCADLENAGYVPERQNDGMMTFRQGGQYLSVSPDLTLYSRDHIGGWERFLDVPEEKIPPDFSFYPPSESIPKIIHQIGLGVKKEGPFINNIEYMNYKNRDYTYIYWDDHRIKNIMAFMGDYYGPHVVDIFQKINPDYAAMQADFLRYLIIYAFGGVYLDLKAVVTVPLKMLLKAKDRLLLAQWKHVAEIHPDLTPIKSGEYINWFIASVSGHPLMRRVLHQVMCNIVFYDRRFAGAGRLGVLRITGPVPYTRAIRSARGAQDFRQIDLESDGLLYRSPYVGENYGILYGRPHYSAFDTDLVKRTA